MADIDDIFATIEWINAYEGEEDDPMVEYLRNTGTMLAEMVRDRLASGIANGIRADVKAANKMLTETGKAQLREMARERATDKTNSILQTINNNIPITID